MLIQLQNHTHTILHWSTPISTELRIWSMDWWWLKGINEGTPFHGIVFILYWLTLGVNRSIYRRFKAMYLTKWSRPYRPSSTSATLFGVMCMTLKVSRHQKMPLTIFTNTVRSSEPVVSIQMVLTSLSPMLQSITSVLLGGRGPYFQFWIIWFVIRFKNWQVILWCLVPLCQFHFFCREQSFFKFHITGNFEALVGRIPKLVSLGSWFITNKDHLSTLLV